MSNESILGVPVWILAISLVWVIAVGWVLRADRSLLELYLLTFDPPTFEFNLDDKDLQSLLEAGVPEVMADRARRARREVLKFVFLGLALPVSALLVLRIQQR